MYWLILGRSTDNKRKKKRERESFLMWLYLVFSSSGAVWRVFAGADSFTDSTDIVIMTL